MEACYEGVMYHKHMKIVRHIFETYLSVVENSVGSNMFRHVWADFDGKRRDTMNGGETSCAFFVSGVLAMFNVIEKAHAVVPSVVDDMVKSGWRKVGKPLKGDVLVWEDLISAPGEPAMPHIGFYVGDEKAISTSWHVKTPILHDYLCRDFEERQIVAIYRGKHLMPDNLKVIEEEIKQV